MFNPKNEPIICNSNYFVNPKVVSWYINFPRVAYNIHLGQ